MGFLSKLVDLLTPGVQVGSVVELDLEALRGRGIRALLLDLDNTLLAWNHLVMSNEVVDWVQWAQGQGFAICLVSNAPRIRLEVQSRVLGVPCLPSAQKPRVKALRRAAQMLGVRSSQCCMVGDQVFTDVLAGNRMGMYTVLVVPMHLKEQWWMKYVRRLERRLVAWLQTRESFKERMAGIGWTLEQW